MRPRKKPESLGLYGEARRGSAMAKARISWELAHTSLNFEARMISSEIFQALACWTWARSNITSYLPCNSSWRPRRRRRYGYANDGCLRCRRHCIYIGLFPGRGLHVFQIPFLSVAIIIPNPGPSPRAPLIKQKRLFATGHA